jgi:small subunit ribosomal protein S13
LRQRQEGPRDYIDQQLKVEGDLRREVTGDIKRLTDMAAIAACATAAASPRGQRTKTNVRAQGPQEDRRR